MIGPPAVAVLILVPRSRVPYHRPAAVGSTAGGDHRSARHAARGGGAGARAAADLRAGHADDGKTTSEFFDAPTQQPPADELAAATAKLGAAIASFPANKGTEVTSEGRLYYGFEAGAAGVRHYTADRVMLDVEYVSNVEGTEGYTGLVITCRTLDPCATGWSEDAEGHASDVTTTGGVRIYVATEQDRDALRGALAELKRLYPAEPKVTAN